MNNSETQRIGLDGVHTLEITFCKEKQTVVVRLINAGGPPELIYAEKFDESCDYLKKGIRRGIEYLEEERKTKNTAREN